MDDLTPEEWRRAYGVMALYLIVCVIIRLIFRS